jgi:hypothetical protein
MEYEIMNMFHLYMSYLIKHVIFRYVFELEGNLCGVASHCDILRCWKRNVSKSWPTSNALRARAPSGTCEAHGLRNIRAIAGKRSREHHGTKTWKQYGCDML